MANSATLGGTTAEMGLSAEERGGGGNVEQDEDERRRKFYAASLARCHTSHVVLHVLFCPSCTATSLNQPAIYIYFATHHS
jgi:hypothetical protein